jgi:predicted PurR-regulated permease PerM
VLTVLMFVLCLAQIGPSLVLIPAVVWVYWNGEIGWGGLFAFGLVGIFVGPVVLAVAYKLLEAWLYDEDRAAIEAPP